MPPYLPLYNQSTQSDDEFVDGFVARQDVLKTLLRRLSTKQPNIGELHHILVGQRGMGKTSLLRRLAIAIDRDPDLKACYIPLSFREEQYNVISLGSFWRNCGEALAEWADATGRADLAVRLDSAMATPAWAGDETAGETFDAELAKLQRRAILLVDNIDLILDALKTEDNWRLRRHLQAKNGPIVIGGATHLLKQGADRDAAFYEFFQPHYLEPLGALETEQCMRTLAERRGNNGAPVLAVLNTQPERLKTLHTLTGGNPRVLALIYRLLEAAESDVAMADLEILLDQVTPYYKARIEEYQSAQQRAVIDAIALNWDPITTGGLSQITDIATTSLSSVLDKLRKDGLTENVDTSGAYAGHQLVERFFNIWYLMRHGTRRTKQKMRWLVGFLTSFYSLRELSEIASRGITKKFHADYSIALEEALGRQSRKQEENYLSPFADSRSEVLAQNTKTQEALLADIYRLNNIAADQWRRKELSKCKESLEEIISRLVVEKEEPALRVEVAKALFNKAVTLGEMGDNALAVATYNNILARFTESEESALREQVAKALFNKAITLGHMSDNAAAVATCDDILTRFEQAEEPALREVVASTLVNKAFTLDEMGDHAAAIATYDELLARCADAIEPVVREQVAKALFNKAFTLSQMGDNAAAIATYDGIFDRFAEAEEPALRELVASALVNKSFTLDRIGDSAGQISTYDEILTRFEDAVEPTLRERLAIALVNKAVTLGRMGDTAAELATYDQLFARFAEAEEPAWRVHLAIALANKASTLHQVGDSAAAIAAYDDILARFADAEESALREEVARALVYKAATLNRMGDNAAAIAAYDDILARFAKAEEPALRELVGSARIHLANLLFDTHDDVTRAEILYLEASVSEPLVANANLAWLYVSAGRVSEAIELRTSLEALPICGRALLDAGLDLAEDNFGSATAHLAIALHEELETCIFGFFSDAERLIRLAERRGYGERLIQWFEHSGMADRIAPIYAALKAYIRGPEVLLDVNPEVRRPAKIIYDRLDAPRRFKGVDASKDQKKRPRGRPKKARSGTARSSP